MKGGRVSMTTAALQQQNGCSRSQLETTPLWTVASISRTESCDGGGGAVGQLQLRINSVGEEEEGRGASQRVACPELPSPSW